MIKGLRKMLLCGLLAASMVLPAFAAAPTHGTAQEWIQADWVDNLVPKSYRINAATQASAQEGRYNEYFLKEQLQTVHITLEEDNLNWLLQNALQEQYVLAQQVDIGGKTVQYCGLRTKGNFTLQHAYHDNPGSDRFSFTVSFNEFVSKESHGENQTFYGCKRISFNNFFFDKSMLKEYFSWMLMEQLGLPTPQFGLAKLYINGEYYGVYAMVEAMDETVLQQHYQRSGAELSSYLCKPVGTRLNYEALQQDPSPLYENDPATYEKVQDMLPTVQEWVRRLNLLAAGKDFEGNAIDVNSQQYLQLLAQVMDVEETVKYFAAHSWLCQMDNLFVNMQNYGLYVSPQGISTLLPWDYDLAFGCFYPSTAENTANFPVDVMYQLNVELWDQEPAQSSAYYRDYPLFRVIYQNQELMERYHSYMLDCSRIAALGGTLSDGRVFEPASFYRRLETLQEPLLAAATEKTADNVYYMNFTQQPRDVKNALPNMGRIIALRAVGVYNQLTGSDAWVCGSGCDLESLGNALNPESAKEGLLTVVDPASGWFATAQFAGGRRAQSPSLAVKQLTQQDRGYDEIRQQLQPGPLDTLQVYTYKISVKAAGSYELTLPLSSQQMVAGAQNSVYLYSGGKLTPLEAEQRDNLITAQVQTAGGTVVIFSGLPLIPQESDDLLGVGVLVGTAAAVIILAVTLGRKRRR